MFLCRLTLQIVSAESSCLPGPAALSDLSMRNGLIGGRANPAPRHPADPWALEKVQTDRNSPFVWDQGTQRKLSGGHLRKKKKIPAGVQLKAEMEPPSPPSGQETLGPMHGCCERFGIHSDKRAILSLAMGSVDLKLNILSVTQISKSHLAEIYEKLMPCR